MVCSPGEKASFLVEYSWTMGEGEIIILEFGNPLLRLAEVFEIFMICEDLEWLLCSKEILMPFVQRDYDSKHLFVVNFVVAFCGVHRFGEEGNWLPKIVLLLRKHST